MKRKKVHVIGLLALCIVALLAVDGTIAYPQDITDPLANHFVATADGLKAELHEPAWQADKATNLVPGSIIAKDPQITNTGDIDVWAAAKVTFCYGPDAGASAGKPLLAADLAKVLAAVTIDWNTTDWSRFDDSLTGDTSLDSALSQTFYYKTPVKAASTSPPAPADTTIPLFSKVTIKASNTQAQMVELKTMGGFQIYIEGSVVQYSGIAAMESSTARSVFSFINTPA
jgi:hypothetical protein